MFLELVTLWVAWKIQIHFQPRLVHLYKTLICPSESDIIDGHVWDIECGMDVFVQQSLTDAGD